MCRITRCSRTSKGRQLRRIELDGSCAYMWNLSSTQKHRVHWELETWISNIKTQIFSIKVFLEISPITPPGNLNVFRESEFLLKHEMITGRKTEDWRRLLEREGEGRRRRRREGGKWGVFWGGTYRLRKLKGKRWIGENKEFKRESVLSIRRNAVVG